MKAKYSYTVIIVFSLLIIATRPALGISIPGDLSIGTWDNVNRIYTLTEDVFEAIQITEDNFTLDGAGYKVVGWNELDIGVYVYQRTGVTIKNLTVQEFVSGIYLEDSSSNILSGNIALNNEAGIWVTNSSNGNTLIANTINWNNWSGISLVDCRDSTLTSNTISNNGYGIFFHGSNDSTLTGNTISNNGYGIWVSGGDNHIYNNNFIYNSTQIYVESYSVSLGNLFNLATPIGGNYWSNWTSPDSDGDGFVDSPYVFKGGPDNLPWVVQGGWLKPEVRLEQLITKVLSLNLQQGIANSLIAKLDAVKKALEDVNENNDGATVNVLDAFINSAEAQRGNKISEADADALIDAAQQIIDLLTDG